MPPHVIDDGYGMNGCLLHKSTFREEIGWVRAEHVPTQPRSPLKWFF